jgi:predicted transcriptional regulator
MQIDPVDRLVKAALISDEEFVHTLREVMQRDLRISVRELAEKSGIAPSSLYKIVHGKRSPNLSTLRAVVHAMRRITHSVEGEFIGLIAARPYLT